jgi:hypothetical protein
MEHVIQFKLIVFRLQGREGTTCRIFLLLAARKWALQPAQPPAPDFAVF